MFKPNALSGTILLICGAFGTCNATGTTCDLDTNPPEWPCHPGTGRYVTDTKPIAQEQQVADDGVAYGR